MQLVTDSTPAAKAVQLVAEIYGQYAEGLTVSSGAELSLSSSGSAEAVKAAPAIIEAILTAAKKEDLLGGKGKKDVSAVLEKVAAGPLDLKALDGELKSRTFAAGSELSAADLAIFASVHSTIAAEKHADHLSHSSLTRHFDHIQHLPEVAAALAKSSTFTVVPIDVEDVPVIEYAAPVKKSKAPAAVAAEGAPAAAAVAAPAKGKAAPAAEPAAKEPATPAAEGAAVEKGKKKEKKEKKGGEGGGGKAPAAPAAADGPPAPWMVDLRVGKIVHIEKHPDADSLYVEQIDIGEAEPRTVVSGLVNYIPIEQMRGRYLIAVCNLKPASMRGVKSFAMVLCASKDKGSEGGGVELMNVPEGSVPGDRVFFEGFEDKTALELLNPKKKIFETVQPGFTTLPGDKTGAWVDPADKAVYKIRTEKGYCWAPTMENASLS